MKQLSLIILLLNTLGAFSEISHDTGFVLGCFFNGSTQIHLEFDGEEVFYFDFQKEKEENYPPEEQDAPESTIYPSEEIQGGGHIQLHCGTFSPATAANEILGAQCDSSSGT
ncbi:hypothetical protein LDENG_00147120 [Lucifuga dentata]|nr:hypothetical protein LDENG_00147120 [Lucifuga dentata]